MEAALKDHVVPLLAARASELREFALLVRATATRGAAPDLAAVPPGVLVTGSAAAACLALLAAPPTRRRVIAICDTALATVLLALIAGVLLALPLGTLYISYRGLLFLGASLADTYPAIAKMLPPPA